MLLTQGEVRRETLIVVMSIKLLLFAFLAVLYIQTAVVEFKKAGNDHQARSARKRHAAPKNFLVLGVPHAISGDG